VSIAIALHCSAVPIGKYRFTGMAGVLWNSGVQPDPVCPNVVRIHGKLASLIGLVSVQSRDDTPTRICPGYFFDTGNTSNSGVGIWTAAHLDSQARADRKEFLRTGFEEKHPSVICKQCS